MLASINNRNGTRRDFLMNGLRYGLLTGVAAMTVALFRRSGGKLTGQTCVNRGICSGCGAFAGCGLPAALSARQARNGGQS